MSKPIKKEPYKGHDLVMMTREEVAGAIGSTVEKVDTLRRAGLLRAIKTGNRWVYPQEELRRFQTEMLGQDLSNADHAVMAAERFREGN